MVEPQAPGAKKTREGAWPLQRPLERSKTMDKPGNADMAHPVPRVVAELTMYGLGLDCAYGFDRLAHVCVCFLFCWLQIPTGEILPVAGTVFDFNSETHTVGERLHQVSAKFGLWTGETDCPN